MNAFQNLSFFPSFFPPQNLGIVPVYCVACIHVMDCISISPKKIKRICNKKGVKTVFKKTKTARDTLTNVKGTHKNSDKGVIYQIPCVDCDHVYIGETGRPFHVRLKEHQRAVTQGDRRNANAKILESIHIKSNSTFNLDSGFPLDQIWTDLISPSH